MPALLCDDPVAALAESLDLYAKTGGKTLVRDFLFPKAMPSKRPEKPAKRPCRKVPPCISVADYERVHASVALGTWF